MHDGPRFPGLLAATYTPLRGDGDVYFEQIGPMVQFLRDVQQVQGLYVCGSTGEGVSLTTEERRRVAEAFVNASNELPVVVQVGHNSLREAQQLARHAESIGAQAISANAPSYFKVTDVATLVACMAETAAAAPQLPFYYYHIPALTGAHVDMLEFLELAAERIPTLAGIKYTAATLHEYRACVTKAEGKFEILWGCDEMLLPALAMGARGAVGSTYNVAGPSYQQILRCFAEGDIAAAQGYQDRCNALIRTVYQYPFHSAMKFVLRKMGMECGKCRLPQPPLTVAEETHLGEQLDALGFFQWND